MKTLISYSKRGGAQVGWVFGSWPFGKIEISNSSVTVSVLGKCCTLTAAEVVRAEPLSVLANDWSPGVCIWYRGEHWEEQVLFWTSSGGEVLEKLKQAGFNVADPEK